MSILFFISSVTFIDCGRYFYFLDCYDSDSVAIFYPLLEFPSRVDDLNLIVLSVSLQLLPVSETFTAPPSLIFLPIVFKGILKLEKSIFEVVPFDFII